MALKRPYDLEKSNILSWDFLWISGTLPTLILRIEKWIFFTVMCILAPILTLHSFLWIKLIKCRRLLLEFMIDEYWITIIIFWENLDCFIHIFDIFLPRNSKLKSQINENKKGTLKNKLFRARCFFRQAV